MVPANPWSCRTCGEEISAAMAHCSCGAHVVVGEACARCERLHEVPDAINGHVGVLDGDPRALLYLPTGHDTDFIRSGVIVEGLEVLASGRLILAQPLQAKHIIDVKRGDGAFYLSAGRPFTPITPLGAQLLQRARSIPRVVPVGRYG